MNRSSLFVVLTTVMFLMVVTGLACAFQPADNDPRHGDDVTSTTVSSPLSYRVGPNDVLRVEVFGEEDLTTETQIGGDGKMTVPLIGGVEVEGMALKDVEALIMSRLAAGYLKHPNVTVSILHYRNVYVSGEVKKPGGYPYETGLTVRKAIALAGGFTDIASESSTEVIRRVNGKEQTIAVELDAVVKPDDIIVVPQSFF